MALAHFHFSPAACDSQSQPRLTVLPRSSAQVSVKSFMSSSPRLSLLLFHSQGALCKEPPPPPPPREAHNKLALHSACFGFQGGMRSGCCCLCVLSWRPCLLSLPVFCPLAQVCRTMSHQWWACKERTKQVPPQSFVGLRAISEESDSQA